MNKIQYLKRMKEYCRERLETELLNVFSKCSNRRVLEIGAGNAQYRTFLKNYEAIDIKPMNSYVKEMSVYDLNLKYPDEEFDVVLLIEVLEHLEYPDKALDNIYNVLKKSGVLVLSVPFSYAFHEDYFRYTEWGLKTILTKHNFRIEVLKPIGNGIYNSIDTFLWDKLHFNLIKFLRRFIPDSKTSPSGYFVVCRKI